MIEPPSLRPPGWSLTTPRFSTSDACDDLMVTAAMLSARVQDDQDLDALQLSRLLTDLTERIGAEIRSRAAR
jgi:hypothetical protein